MPLSTWLKAVRLHWLSPSDHWASVMAEADALEAEHNGDAAVVARDAYEGSKSDRARRLMGDVETELRRRSHAP
jgi:hypothetical protein